MAHNATSISLLYASGTRWHVLPPQWSWLASSALRGACLRFHLPNLIGLRKSLRNIFLHVYSRRYTTLSYTNAVVSVALRRETSPQTLIRRSERVRTLIDPAILSIREPRRVDIPRTSRLPVTPGSQSPDRRTIRVRRAFHALAVISVHWVTTWSIARAIRYIKVKTFFATMSSCLKLYTPTNVVNRVLDLNIAVGLYAVVLVVLADLRGVFRAGARGKIFVGAEGDGGRRR